MRLLYELIDRRIIPVISPFLLCILWVGASSAQSFGVKEKRVHFESQRTDSSETKEEKSPKGAMIRTLVIPGWGQLYNEQYIKAGLVFSVRSFLIGLAVYYQVQLNKSTLETDRNFYITKRNDAIVFYGIATIISMIDAYIDAHLYDFDVGPELEFHVGGMSSQGSQSQIPGIGLTLRKRF